MIPTARTHRGGRATRPRAPGKIGARGPRSDNKSFRRGCAVRDLRYRFAQPIIGTRPKSGSAEDASRTDHVRQWIRDTPSRLRVVPASNAIQGVRALVKHSETSTPTQQPSGYLRCPSDPSAWDASAERRAYATASAESSPRTRCRRAAHRSRAPETPQPAVSGKPREPDREATVDAPFACVVTGITRQGQHRPASDTGRDSVFRSRSHPSGGINANVLSSLRAARS